jgi:hypothetical protein
MSKFFGQLLFGFVRDLGLSLASSSASPHGVFFPVVGLLLSR